MKEEKHNLSEKKLRFSEFIFGLFIGIFASSIVEIFFQVYKVDSKSFLPHLFILTALLVLSFLFYKRMIGLPDLAEYKCKISINKESKSRKEFKQLFYKLLKENLRKKRGTGVKLHQNKVLSMITRIKGYERAELNNLWMAKMMGFIYYFENKEDFIFLIGIEKFSNKSDLIVSAIDDTFEDLSGMDVIHKNYELSGPRYYFISQIYPFRKKGKLVE
jgi:hypothetical protein